MANTKPVVNQSNDPANLEDLGFKHGSALNTVKHLAKWALEKVKGFPETVSSDDVLSVRKGYAHRWSLDHPAVEYVVIEGNYLRASDLTDIPAKAERVLIGYDVAFSYTQQQAGKLKETHSPEYHKLIAGVRSDVNAYTSNCWGKLMSAGKAVKLELSGVKKERTPNLDFVEYLYDKEKGIFSIMQTRCKNAKAKGDMTADERQLQAGIVAFNVAFKGYKK
jgi:hypothetical protein